MTLAEDVWFVAELIGSPLNTLALWGLEYTLRLNPGSDNNREIRLRLAEGGNSAITVPKNWLHLRIVLLPERSYSPPFSKQDRSAVKAWRALADLIETPLTQPFHNLPGAEFGIRYSCETGKWTLIISLPTAVDTTELPSLWQAHIEEEVYSIQVETDQQEKEPKGPEPQA